MPSRSATVARPVASSRVRGHPIQVVMLRTGLSADVIRAWEKRYAVVTPGRSVAGRRVYSDADIERLRLLARATLTGRTIGQVAGLSDAALAQLARESGTDATAADAAVRRDDAPAEAASAAARAPAPATGGGLLAASVDAIERFDAAALEAILRRGVIALSAESFLDALVVPLWERVAESAAAFRPAHRHLTLGVLRRVLGGVSEAAAAGASPHLLATTLPGFPHASQELGTLLTAATATAEGWRVTVAGPALPAEDVAELVVALGADAVVVSLGAAPGDRAVPRELRRLRALLPPRVGILLAGASAAAHHATARQVDATVVRDLPALRARLRQLLAEPER